MTPEDLDRATEEYEKALVHIITNVKCGEDGRLFLRGGELLVPGTLHKLLEDITALAYLKGDDQTEGEQE
jgi:hypothetical protein